jgi:acyl-coenzyme A thioesterase PaaI-like protein
MDKNQIMSQYDVARKNMTAIQDLYPGDFAHCFGCGIANTSGHQLKSYARGSDVIAHFTPSPHHMSVPGFVYGGLLASLVDCHAMASAAAGLIENGVAPRFVTAALRVDYLKPTPLGPELEISGHVKERSEKKAVVHLTVTANGVITVRAEVVAVRIPKTMEKS